jgi:hypothetical protein
MMNAIECLACDAISLASSWTVEYSQVLDAPVLECPICGDGFLFASPIGYTGFRTSSL